MAVFAIALSLKALVGIAFFVIFLCCITIFTVDIFAVEVFVVLGAE